MGWGRKKNTDGDKNNSSVDQVSMDDYKDEPQVPCRTCGRSFAKSVLHRHEPICQRSARAKRRVFDSGKQRATDSDITISSVRSRQKEFVKRGGRYSPPKTTWQARSNEVRRGTQTAREIKEAIAAGKPMPKMQRSRTPEDYVECKHCGRKFNAAAADRHIPSCKSKHDDEEGGGNQRTRSQIRRANRADKRGDKAVPNRERSRVSAKPARSKSTVRSDSDINHSDHKRSKSPKGSRQSHDKRGTSGRSKASKSEMSLMSTSGGRAAGNARSRSYQNIPSAKSNRNKSASPTRKDKGGRTKSSRSTSGRRQR